MKGLQSDAKKNSDDDGGDDDDDGNDDDEDDGGDDDGCEDDGGGEDSKQCSRCGRLFGTDSKGNWLHRQGKISYYYS